MENTDEESSDKKYLSIEEISQKMQLCKMEKHSDNLESTLNTLSEVKDDNTIFYYSNNDSAQMTQQTFSKHKFNRNLSLDSLDPFIKKLKLALEKHPSIGLIGTIKQSHRQGSKWRGTSQLKEEFVERKIIQSLNAKSFKNQYVPHPNVNQGLSATLDYPSKHLSDHTMSKDSKDYLISESRKQKIEKLINTLSEIDDVSFLDVFLEHKQEFLEFLPQIDTIQSTIPQVIDIVLKIFKIEHPTKQNILFSLINEEFVGKIISFITLLPVESEVTLTDCILENFLQNILLFCERMNHEMHQNKSAVLLRKVLISLRYAMKGFDEVKRNIPESIKEKIQEQCKLMENQNFSIKKYGIKSKINTESEHLLEPPNNIRDIDIFPTKKDLFEPATFLRKNVVNGAYRNVDHYIDVQFRLLREDFIAPLRSGLQLYCQSIANGKQEPNQRFDNIRIHNDVKILHGTITNNRLGHLVQLRTDIGHHGNTKRFMFGSLLLFTADNYGSFFCGTVINPAGENLLIVDLCGNESSISDIYLNNYIMIESEVFFGPYYHVLTALQEFDYSNFPMKEYIVDVKTNNEGLEVENKSIKCPPLLNESQKKAYKAAVTNEFVVIQGPPGTGKTFLAEAITKYLLIEKEQKITNILNRRRFFDLSLEHERYDFEYYKLNLRSTKRKHMSEEDICPCYPNNRPIFHKFFCELPIDGKPILIICYTNHALDQFLERLMLYTSKIIRVGGQSKNDIVQNCNLKEIRRCWIKEQTFNRKYCGCSSCSRHLSRFNTYFNLTESVQRYMFQYLVHLNILEAIATDGVLRVEYLVPWLSVGLSNILYRQKQFEAWLLEGAYVLDIKEDDINHDIKPEFIVNTQQLLSEIRESSIFRDDMEFFNVTSIECKATNEADSHFVTKVSKLISHTYNMQSKLRKCRRNGACDSIINMFERQIESLEKQRRYITCMLQHKPRIDLKRISELLRTSNIWKIDFEDRWMLYHYWAQGYENKIKNEMLWVEMAIAEREQDFTVMRDQFDLELLKSASIIGMTTTGAARLRSSLVQVAPEIVVVEEAAEVLEAHVIVALTPSVKKVILIGDHKQLKPNPAVYELAQQYKLDVSLFERMLNNGLACHVLDTQQRMRPEIASLISPAIYSDLKNGERVFERPDIRGVAANVFFITHNNLEDETFGDSRSHRNSHEVDFIIALCQYLLQQDYRPSSITILATYLGQMTALENERRRQHLPSAVRIATVDNYQGEENDIILLSLVRSNAEARIGFLSEENRVCVALSRAKNGLFIVGNMDNLTLKRTVWRQVKAQLESMNAIGPALPLGCRYHQNDASFVSCGNNFKNVPTSGCKMKCKAQLECGHICQSFCHSYDLEHKEKFACSFPCERMVCEVHRCQNTCGSDCGLCNILVEKQLPCGHEVRISCSEDVTYFRCQELVTGISDICGHVVTKSCSQTKGYCTEPCTSTMDCGHPCVSRCHTNLIRDKILNYNRHGKEFCTMMVEKVFGCGHTSRIACKDSVNKVTCQEPCPKMLPCDHPCRNLCGEPCDKTCDTPVEKSLAPCGHQLVLPCSSAAESSQCREPCQKTLPCGHPCAGNCSADCSRFPCQEHVRCEVVPGCGHELVTLPCSINSTDLQPNSDQLLQHCHAPCRADLACGHLCVGTCGACLQGRLHVPCSYPCARQLNCGHRCKKKCSDECLNFCDRPCMYRCSHQECSQLCGDPCTPCKRQCERQCRHQQCTQPCSEDCDCPPCSEPCPCTLPCGHQCSGYCGETCSKYCIICHPDVYFIPGHPSYPDVDRYVTLEDCGHPIEERFLRKLIIDERQNGLGKCPICDKPIQFVLRFKEDINKFFLLLASAKKEEVAKLVIFEKRMKTVKYNIKHYHSDNTTEIYGHNAFVIREHLKKAPLVYKTSMRVFELFKALTTSDQRDQRENNSWDAVLERRKLLLGALSLRLESMNSTEFKEFMREIFRLKVATSNWADNSHLLFSLRKYSLDELDEL